MLPVDSMNTEIVMESTTKVHEKVRSALKAETTVSTQHTNIGNINDNVDTVHSTQRVIIDLTAKRAANTPVKGCKSEGKLLPGLDIE